MRPIGASLHRLACLGLWKMPRLVLVCAAVLCWSAALSTSPARARPGQVTSSTLLPSYVPGARLYRIVYTSTGLHGEAIPVTGIVVVPEGPAPAGGRDIVAWAHPTTGVAPACAPSLRANPLANIPGLREMLARGWIVAATDYPGLGTVTPHPYLVGISEGRAVLDSVRAARQLAGPQAGRRFVVWGHSQGGQASLFTGQLARAYAPELQLKGVAAAAPASELAALFSADLSTIQGKLLTALTLWSWSRVYGAPLGPVVEPEQVAEIDRIASLCPTSLGNDLDLYFAARALQRSFLKVDDLTKLSPWRGLIARNTPRAAAIPSPLFIAQGTADIIVRPQVTENYVQRLCRAGKTVAFDLVPGLSHTQIAHASAPAAVTWMAGRFAGEPAPSNCGRGP